MNKLPEDFKQKWVAALRSGKYVQANGTLYRETERNGKDKLEMCCLGVACHVAGIPLESMNHKGLPTHLKRNNPINFDKLPEDIADISDDQYDNSIGLGVLAQMNDSGNYDFDAIADFIDKNY